MVLVGGALFIVGVNYVLGWTLTAALGLSLGLVIAFVEIRAKRRGK